MEISENLPQFIQGNSQSSTFLNEADVRDMVRLLGETAALQGDHLEKKRYLMTGISKLITAESWSWALGSEVNPGNKLAYTGFLYGGFNEERFCNLVTAIEHPDMAEAMFHFTMKMKERRAHVTMRREEIDPDGLAYEGELGKLLVDTGIDSILLAGYPLGKGMFSAVSFVRPMGSVPFSERERKIAHILIGEVEWLHQSCWPRDRAVEIPKLYPRQRIVLNLLLDGMTRKQIAEHMRISENTVAGYASDVYKHFQVSSHVELIKKFFRLERES